MQNEAVLQLIIYKNEWLKDESYNLFFQKAFIFAIIILNGSNEKEKGESQ